MLRLWKIGVRTSGTIGAHFRLPKVPQLCSLPCARYATFAPREFQFETSDGETGTLIHRFCRHIALTKRDFTDVTQYDFKVSSYFPVHDVRQFTDQLDDLTVRELAKLVTFASDIRAKATFGMFTDVVNALDAESESRVSQANTNELLEMLHSFMYLLPNKIAKLAAYQAAMPKLVELYGQERNEKHFLTIAFFLALWKRNQSGALLMKEFFDKHLHDYLSSEELSTMDFAILANATYKASVRLHGNDLFINRLIDEIKRYDSEDPAVLVTLVKCARMNRLQSTLIVDKVKSVVENAATVKDFDFRGLSHLFAYIADNRIKDDELSETLVRQCWSQFQCEIRESALPQTASFRPKDIATFLWSCSTLAQDLKRSPVELDVVCRTLLHTIDAGLYRYNPDTLFDTVLSLWILNHRPMDLVKHLLNSRELWNNARKERVKIESRKDLLLSCLEIEALAETSRALAKVTKLGNAFTLQRKAPEFLLRPSLQRVKECIDGLAGDKSLRIDKIAYNLPIKNLNIAGILVVFSNGSVINVDVLDDRHCLSDNVTPVGLMQLKQRLLHESDVITVQINTLMSVSAEEITEALRKQFTDVAGKK